MKGEELEVLNQKQKLEALSLAFDKVLDILEERSELYQTFRDAFPNGDRNAITYLTTAAVKSLLRGEKVWAVKGIKDHYGCPIHDALGLVHACLGTLTYVAPKSISGHEPVEQEGQRVGYSSWRNSLGS